MIHNISHWFSIVNEVIVLWVSTNTGCALFLDIGGVDDIGLLYLFVTLPLILLGVINIFKNKQKDVYKMQEIKTEESMDFYLITLYELIKSRE